MRQILKTRKDESIFVSHKITNKSLEILRRLEGSLSLDAGCGKGFYLPFFKSTVIALDLSNDELKKARKRNPCKTQFVVGDIRYLPFKDKTFSYLQSLDTIEHLNLHEAEGALKEFERVTSGNIQIGTPNVSGLLELFRSLLFPGWLFDKNPMSKMPSESPHRHRSLWTNRELEKYGFKVHGCLGWVTAERIGNRLVTKCYDILAWNIPVLAGSLIGLKEVE